MKKTILLVMLLQLISLKTFGAVAIAKLERVGATYQGIHVVLDIVDHDINNCAGAYAQDSMLLQPAADNYDVIVSFLLASYMANKTVRINAVGCSGQGYTTIRDVSIID